MTKSVGGIKSLILKIIWAYIWRNFRSKNCKYGFYARFNLGIWLCFSGIICKMIKIKHFSNQVLLHCFDRSIDWNSFSCWFHFLLAFFIQIYESLRQISVQSIPNFNRSFSFRNYVIDRLLNENYLWHLFRLSIRSNFKQRVRLHIRLRQSHCSKSRKFVRTWNAIRLCF